MADPTALRQALADFLGAERFRKFVREFRSAGRLRFWQEQEWGRFVAGRPAFAGREGELAVALRVCWVHGAELQPDTAEVIAGHLDYTTQYVRAKAAEFPCAASSPVSSESHQPPIHAAEVWFCPECREAEAAWRDRHAPKAARDAARWEQRLAEIRARPCPSCGRYAVSMICYGRPDLSDAMNAALEAKLIRLGGCTIFDDSPAWVCRDCAHTWGRTTPPGKKVDPTEGA